MADLVFELFCEEIPAGMQAGAALHLRAQVSGGLEEAGLTHDRFDVHVTPRRLAVVVTGLPERTQDTTVERKGPRVGAPDAAVQGFLKSTGLTLEQCEQRDGVWFATVRTPGKPAAEALAPILEKAAANIPWPKSMRWGANTMRWVRPLRGILSLFDGQVVPVSIGHVSAENVTWGHRFLAPQAITLAHAKEYEAALEKAFVTLDPEVRKRQILERAKAMVAAQGLVLKEDQGLLDEVAGLVEYPVVLMGRFEDRYLALPVEVPSTVMKSHQKYFTVLTEDGKLAPWFVFVANMQTTDGGATIIAGNERVVRARLADGEFYWEQDVKTPLESRLPGLEDMVFHAKLGSMAAKVGRIETLAAALAAHIPGADAKRTQRAAKLAKADLVSGMVGEFPELQGIMGRYYALQQNESHEVADAIRDHYRPLGPSDVCPTAPDTVAVALADKLDTLAGMFAVGEKPTGSKDPFALRRAALGVIRLVLENGLRLRLREQLVRAMRGHGKGEGAVQKEVAELLEFFADRLKVMMKDQGIAHDRIAAVFAGGEGNTDDLVQLVARAKALEAFLATEDGAKLLAGYKRARNLVTKSGVAAESLKGEPTPGEQAEEQGLYQAFLRLRETIAPLGAKEDYTGVMRALAAMRLPVDAYLDAVRVEKDAGKLTLLNAVCLEFEKVADFGKVEG